MANSKNLFRLADGQLTKYALLCGYVSRESSNGFWKEMYIEYNTIHVRYGKDGEKYMSWESYDTSSLKYARTDFKNIKLNNLAREQV